MTAAPKTNPNEAPIIAGLSSIFVQVGTQRLEAQARPDLGRCIFSAVAATGAENDGPAMHFYRVDPAADWPEVVDVTDEMEAKILARQRRIEERRERQTSAVDDRLKLAANQTPASIRKGDDAVTDEWSDTAGVKRLRVRTPLQILHAKRLLTGRQFSAGQALHEDHLLSMMVRQPADEGGGAGLDNGGGNACFETAAIAASTRITRARIRCDRQDPGIWPVVWGVVVREVTVSVLAGSDRGRDREPYMLALRCGLDIISDCYGMPNDYTKAEVWVGALSVVMEIAQDHESLWRARSLNEWPWTAEGKDAGEVYKLARAEMRNRIFQCLGYGPYRDQDIADAVEADREAARAARAKRREREKERQETQADELNAERARVVRR